MYFLRESKIISVAVLTYWMVPVAQCEAKKSKQSKTEKQNLGPGTMAQGLNP